MQRDSRFVKWKKVLGKKDLKDALTGVKPDPSGWTLKKGKNVACADGSVEGVREEGTWRRSLRGSTWRRRSGARCGVRSPVRGQETAPPPGQGGEGGRPEKRPLALIRKWWQEKR